VADGPASIVLHLFSVQRLLPCHLRGLPSLLHFQRFPCCVQLLRSVGVKDAINVAGGLQAWTRDIDAAFPQY
jgi:hypothetical protein